MGNEEKRGGDNSTKERGLVSTVKLHLPNSKRQAKQLRQRRVFSYTEKDMPYRGRVVIDGKPGTYEYIPWNPNSF